MRLNINLASQPYEVARSYQRRMTMAITALAIVAVVLIGYILYLRQHSRGVNRQIASVRRQIQLLDSEEAQARAILNKPANRVVADQSDYLNQLFARKALSWTRLFGEMEKIVPTGLHVVSMKPEYTKTNDLVLHVLVATDSRDRAVELVRNMEKSTHLRQAQIVAEAVTTGSGDQAAGGGNIQFDIAASYVPGAFENETAEPAKESGANDSGAQPAPAPVKRAATAPARTPAVRATQPVPHTTNQPAPTFNGAVVTNSSNQAVNPNGSPNSQLGSAQRPVPAGRIRGQ